MLDVDALPVIDGAADVPTEVYPRASAGYSRATERPHGGRTGVQMLTIDLRRAARLGTGVAVLISLITPPAFSQRIGAQQRQSIEQARPGPAGIAEADTTANVLDADELRRLIEDLEQQILDAEAKQGPNAEELIEPLSALGRAYQQSGQHILAIVATRQAIDVVRYNLGLHSLEQTPLLDQTMVSERAIGNVAGVWALDQELLALARRYPDDLRTAGILRATADRRMNVLRRYRGGEFPEEIILGCYYEPELGSEQERIEQARGEERDCNAGSSRNVQRRLLSEARSYYADAVRVFLRNEEYSDPELVELEMRLVRSSYAFGGGVDGKESLRRLLSYQVANSAPLLARIDTIVQMADWDLLYAHRARATKYIESALAVYQEAYQELERNGVEQASIDELFAPRVPVTIPIFEPNPLATDAAGESAAYVDVAFDVTSRGRGEHVEIIDATAEVTRAERGDVIRLIEQTSFRPRSTDGRFEGDSRVVLRYYVRPGGPR